MKKEQVQRLVLLGLLIVMGLFFFFNFLIAPLGEREKKAKVAITQLEPKIADAKRQINRTRAIKDADPHAEAAAALFALLKSEIPNEAAVAWFPQRIVDHFKKHGIERPSMQNTASAADPEIPGFQTSHWTLGFNAVPFVKFGEAIAALENGEGMLQILNLRLESSASDAENQKASLELSTVVKP